MPRSPQKHLTVLAVLRRARRPLPAEAVVRRVRDAHPSVGRATVYRSLRTLVASGIVERYPDGYGSRDRESDHHHVICRDCGRDAVPALARVERELADAVGRAGFRILAHDIRVDASCAEHPS